jgi:hypothetical protein
MNIPCLETQLRHILRLSVLVISSDINGIQMGTGGENSPEAHHFWLSLSIVRIPLQNLIYSSFSAVGEVCCKKRLRKEKSERNSAIETKAFWKTSRFRVVNLRKNERVVTLTLEYCLLVVKDVVRIHLKIDLVFLLAIFSLFKSVSLPLHCKS